MTINGRGRGRIGRVLRALGRGLGRLTLGAAALALLSALLIGLPWALTHYIGWPLPDHLPRLNEVATWLWYGNFHTGVLVDVLAIACWILWAVFTLDVARCLVDAARGIRWPEVEVPAGPTRLVASLLVGGLLLALLGHRIPGSSAAALPTGHPSAAPVVATAGQYPAREAELSTATVAEPVNGVHDSLWRIAGRRLDDPTRWPEIWRLNKHRIQNDGRVFTNPHVVHPGWVLLLPDQHPPDRLTNDRPDTQPDPELHPDTPAGAERHAPAPPSASPPTATSERGAPSTANTPSPALRDLRGDHATASDGEPDHTPATSSALDPKSDPDAGTGISLPSGGWVGLGLAAMITALAIAVRLWRRRTYRPGSGDRDDPYRVPIVRALRVAYDQAVLPHDSDGAPIHPASPTSTTAEAAARERARVTAAAVLPAGPDTVVGVCSGHAVALDLARTRGVGLVGPGAPAAARALLISLLTPRDTTNAVPALPAARVVVPTSDLPTLFGAGALLEHPPRALRIVTDLDAALDDLETELLTRRRHTTEKRHLAPSAVVLMATASAHAEARLGALLQDGAEYGLASVLMGQWLPGGTAYVLDDGTVSATSPHLADRLDGTRLFTLLGSDASALLGLLRAADDAEQDYDSRAADPDTCEVGTAAPTPADDTTRPATTTDLATPVETTTPCGTVPDSDPKADDNDTDAVPSTMNGDDTGPAMTLCVLGRPHLYYYGAGDDTTDLIEAVSPKQREVLTYLGLHRSGASSDAIAAAIWPDARGRRPQNTFHVTVSQLRKSIRTATDDAAPGLIVVHDGYYALHPDEVTVDLWQLQDLLRDARTGSELARRQEALERIAEFSHGPLGADITAEWIEAPREALRRDVLDAISALIHTLGEGHDDRKLALLELARGLDQYNEAIYRDIARTLARLGHADAIVRTQKLLTDTLSDIDERPRRDTLDLMESLQRAAETHPVPPGDDNHARAATAPERRRTSKAAAHTTHRRENTRLQ